MNPKKNTVKVLCVQFEPKYKDIKSNISHLEQNVIKIFRARHDRYNSLPRNVPKWLYIRQH